MGTNIFPIIFIPGIKGTTLSDHYPLDHQLVYSAVTEKLFSNFDPVMLDDEGRFDKDLDRLIYEHEVISLVYGEMVSELRENLPFDPVEKSTVKTYVFPYDWRFPVAVNAERLGKFIEIILAKSNAHPAYKDRGITVDKVNLVAHSMGGCLAKHYATVLGGHIKLKKLVMLASPLRGSVYALKTLIMGETWFFDWFTRKGLRRLARTLPGVYDLLPFDGYFSSTGRFKWPKPVVTKDGQAVNIFDAGEWQKNVTDQIGSNILQGHLQNTFRYFEKAADFPDAFKENVLMVYGTGEKTLRYVSASDPAGGREFDFPGDDGSPTIGDGVVPAISTYVDGIYQVGVTKKAVGDWELDLGKVAGFHASFCAYDLVQDLTISFLREEILKPVRDRFHFQTLQDIPKFSTGDITHLEP